MSDLCSAACTNETWTPKMIYNSVQASDEKRKGRA